MAQPAAAAPGLVVELNRAEDAEDGCRVFFVIDNRTGHHLEALRLELVPFDPEGVVGRPLLVDMAPVRDGRRTVAGLVLDRPCAGIGSILINDVPVCRSSDAGELDCLALLETGSRATIALE
jgi:hypothetical protein